MSKKRNREQKLTQKQKTYCEEYVLNGNNRIEAYKKAYKTQGSITDICANSTHLHKNTLIIQYIKELQGIKNKEFNDIFANAKIDSIKRFEYIKEMALQEKKVVTTIENVNKGKDMFGNDIVVETKTKSLVPNIDYNAIIKCEECIAKIKNAYSDTQIINNNNNINDIKIQGIFE